MVDEKTEEKNFNLVSYWALAYNCIVLDKIMIYISMAGLIFLGFFTETKITAEMATLAMFVLKGMSIIAFTITLIVSLILLKINNKVMIAVLENDNIKNDLGTLAKEGDGISFTNCLIGIITLVLFILFK